MHIKSDKWISVVARRRFFLARCFFSLLFSLSLFCHLNIVGLLCFIHGSNSYYTLLHLIQNVKQWTPESQISSLKSFSLFRLRASKSTFHLARTYRLCRHLLCCVNAYGFLLIYYVDAYRRLDLLFDKNTENGKISERNVTMSIEVVGVIVTFQMSNAYLIRWTESLNHSSKMVHSPKHNAHLFHFVCLAQTELRIISMHFEWENARSYTIHLLVIKFATHHNRINIVSCICTNSLDPIIMHWHTHSAHALPRKASKISEIKLKINSVRLKWLRLSDAICIDKIDRNCVHTRNAKHFKTFCMQQPRAGGTLSFAATNAFYQHAHNRAIVWCQWQHVDVLCALIWFSMHSSVARRTSIEVINDKSNGHTFPANAELRRECKMQMNAPPNGQQQNLISSNRGTRRRCYRRLFATLIPEVETTEP